MIVVLRTGTLRRVRFVRRMSVTRRGRQERTGGRPDYRPETVPVRADRSLASRAILRYVGRDMPDRPSVPPAAIADRRLWSRLRRRLARRVDHQDVDDSLHAAFLRLERYRADHAVDNVEAFLVRAAGHLATDAHRRRRFLADRPVEVECAGMIDPYPLQDEVVAVRDRLLHVRKGLDALSPRTREAFEMHRLDGLKYREIAERMQISQSAVEKHIAKAALFLAQWTRDW